MLQSVRKFFLKQKLAVVGVVIGAAGGYLYYHFIGCASGTCPITSHPIISSLYGALLGGLLFSMFNKEETKNNNQNSI